MLLHIFLHRGSRQPIVPSNGPNCVLPAPIANYPAGPVYQTYQPVPACVAPAPLVQTSISPVTSVQKNQTQVQSTVELKNDGAVEIRMPLGRANSTQIQYCGDVPDRPGITLMTEDRRLVQEGGETKVVVTLRFPHGQENAGFAMVSPGAPPVKVNVKDLKAPSPAVKPAVNPVQAEKPDVEKKPENPKTVTPAPIEKPKPEPTPDSTPEKQPTSPIEAKPITAQEGIKLCLGKDATADFQVTKGTTLGPRDVDTLQRALKTSTPGEKIILVSDPKETVTFVKLNERECLLVTEFKSGGCDALIVTIKADGPDFKADNLVVQAAVSPTNDSRQLTPMSEQQFENFNRFSDERAPLYPTATQFAGKPSAIGMRFDIVREGFERRRYLKNEIEKFVSDRDAREIVLQSLNSNYGPVVRSGEFDISIQQSPGEAKTTLRFASVQPDQRPGFEMVLDEDCARKFYRVRGKEREEITEADFRKGLNLEEKALPFPGLDSPEVAVQQVAGYQGTVTFSAPKKVRLATENEISRILSDPSIPTGKAVSLGATGDSSLTFVKLNERQFMFVEVRGTQKIAVLYTRTDEKSPQSGAPIWQMQESNLTNNTQNEFRPPGETDRVLWQYNTNVSPTVKAEIPSMTPELGLKETQFLALLTTCQERGFGRFLFKPGRRPLNGNDLMVLTEP